MTCLAIEVVCACNVLVSVSDVVLENLEKDEIRLDTSVMF